MKKGKLIVWLLFIVYLVTLVDLLFFSRAYDSASGVNLVPMNQIELFYGLLSSPNYSFRKLAIINLFGNILIFVPFGFFISILFKRFKNYFNLLLFSFGFVLICEYTQYYFKIGTFDVDDIILNLLGVTIGYLLYWIIWRLYECFK
ncbi:MAG: VanZ family protein [Erysipelotrichaceae bacterium]